MLAAVASLPGAAVRKVKVKPLLATEIDEGLVLAMWKRAIYATPDVAEGGVDRDAYAVCVLDPNVEKSASRSNRHLMFSLATPS